MVIYQIIIYAEVLIGSGELKRKSTAGAAKTGVNNPAVQKEDMQIHSVKKASLSMSKISYL